MKSIYLKLLKIKFYIKIYTKIYTKILIKKLTILWIKYIPIISFVVGGVISVISICCLLYAWLNFFYLIRHFLYVLQIEAHRVEMLNRLNNQPFLDPFDNRVLDRARIALQNPGRIDPYTQLVNQVSAGNLVNAQYLRTALQYGGWGFFLGGTVFLSIVVCIVPNNE